jgi:hypothetical protein
MSDTTMTAEAAIADGSREAATKALEGLHAKFKGPAPSATPTDAAGARARLDALTADPSWSRAFFDGHQATVAEFKTLTAQIAAGNPTADALAGAKPSEGFEIETTISGSLSTRARADAVAGLRQLGLSDDVVAQAIDGAPAPISVQELNMARMKKATLLSDPDFSARYLAGSLIEKQTMSLLNLVISGASA